MPRVHPIDTLYEHQTTRTAPDHTTRTALDPTGAPTLYADEQDDLAVVPPSSVLCERPRKRGHPHPGKRLKWHNKNKAKLPSGGVCHLLALPEDVLRALLGRMPPRSLKALGQTCAGLRRMLQDEAIWRECYIHRFVVDLDAVDSAKEDISVLVQGCTGSAARGWKKEALGRQAMLERWTLSKAQPVTHHPSVGLVHALSLSYPVSTAIPRGTVGKADDTADPIEAATTPAKLTHRQKYQALIAATTRPPPHVLSAGLGTGAIVKSDPIGGKVSKGFWGPGRDANFHIHPQFNPAEPPTAVHLPDREQSYALWGLLNGTVVHTALLTKHPSAPGARAASVNTTCRRLDAHVSEVLDIWAPKRHQGPLKFVSSGVDGRVLYWMLNAPLPGKVKKAQHANNEGLIELIFDSDQNQNQNQTQNDDDTQSAGSDPPTAVDPCILVRCDSANQVVVGLSANGALKIWYNVETLPKEIIVNVETAAELGPVHALEIDVEQAEDLFINVLVHHLGAASFARYNVTIPADGDYTTSKQIFATPYASRLTALKAFLDPSPPISTRSALAPALSSVTFDDSSSSHSSEESESDVSVTDTPAQQSPFGRFVVAGDADGAVWIWPWDREDSNVLPMRGWAATERKITALDYHCGLVAVGSCDAHVKVYDPLPALPVCLKSFRVAHLSPGELLIAESDDPMAAFLGVNQIILENDLVVASVGRKVFAWRAASGKKRDSAAKGDKKRGGGARVKTGLGAIDMRSVREDVRAERADGDEEQGQDGGPSESERQQLAAMEQLGLDGDDALQYALMLSMDEQDGGAPSPSPAATPYTPSGDEHVDEAVRAADEYAQREEAEMLEALELVRLAQEAEARARS